MQKITAFKDTVTATGNWSQVDSKEVTFVTCIWPVDTAITEETGGDPEDRFYLLDTRLIAMYCQPYHFYTNIGVSVENS